MIGFIGKGLAGRKSFVVNIILVYWAGVSSGTGALKSPLEDKTALRLRV